MLCLHTYTHTETVAASVLLEQSALQLRQCTASVKSHSGALVKANELFSFIVIIILDLVHWPEASAIVLSVVDPVHKLAVTSTDSVSYLLKPHCVPVQTLVGDIGSKC